MNEQVYVYGKLIGGIIIVAAMTLYGIFVLRKNRNDIVYVVTVFIMLVMAFLALLLFFNNVKADNTSTTYIPMVSKATDWNIFIEPPPGTYNGAGIEVFHDPEVRGWCKALIFDLLTGTWKNKKLTVAYDEYYPCTDAHDGVELWFDETVCFNTVMIEQYNDDMDLVGIHKKYVGQYRVCQWCGPVPVP